MANTKPDASQIVFQPAGTGAVATTVQGKLCNIIQVNDFVTAGVGTAASPWTGWDTAIVWAGSTQYNFIDGVYAYATSPNFAKDFLSLNGSKGTVIQHTGTGNAMLVDAGSASELVTGVDIGGGNGITLKSNSGATRGVYMRGVIHSSANIRFNNVPGVCFLEISGVLNTLRLETTALVVGQSVQPANLYADERRGAGQETSAGTYYLLAENCSAYGVQLNYCLNGLFLGLTSEANGGGYYVDTGAKYNTFIGCDLEDNTFVDAVNKPDIFCSGQYNTFINVISTGTSTFNGLGNIIQGGAYNKVNCGGTNNVFGPFSYSNNGGAFTDTGTNTTTRSLYNSTSSTMRVDVAPNPVESVKTGSGSFSADTNVATTLFTVPGRGRYEVIAYLGVGDAANFTASATVLCEGSVARIISNNGALLTLTLSGLNVQATQTAGTTQTIVFNYLRIF